MKRSASPKGTGPATGRRVAEILAWLRRRGTRHNREGMARYGISSPRMFGVSMAGMQSLARRLGRDHALAAALWKTGWFEARMLTAFVEDPALVTPAQMDRWARDFDNWAICDTLCFRLFDQTPHAWRKVEQWSRRKEEFVRRAAFALLASLALHDRQSGDAPFRRALRLVESASVDERNFVKKGVSWALRSIGGRSSSLHAAAIRLARRLAARPSGAARWIGNDALRDLTRPLVVRRVAARETRTRRARQSSR